MDGEALHDFKSFSKMAPKNNKKNPVFPGDLLSLNTDVEGVLLGIVLSHHDEIAGMGNPYNSFCRGPGVSIHWTTNNLTVYWPYKDISLAMKQSRMKVLKSSS